MTSREEGVTAVIPVKPWALSKSRLAVGDEARADLARAFALDVIDVVSACSAVGKVVLVSAEPELGALAAKIGAVLLTDRPMLAPDALDRAVDAARRWSTARRPASPVVVVPGDLPALTVATFERALGCLGRHDRAFVPDAAGRGTTLTWARNPWHLSTSYGPSSATKHSGAGFQPVADVDARVRWDVDTVADLAEVRRLGLNRRSAEAVEEILAGSLSRA